MSIGTHGFLERSGLTNRHAEMGDYVSERKKIRVAYCNSQSCMIRNHGYVSDQKGRRRLNSNRSVRKQVSSQAWQCPDCFSVLFWELE